MGNKVVRDPVHGYVSIDDRLCQFFIDTPIFQRLRSIEQTSMRCLFPGGRHDRFIHSLGVYHLAQRLYDRLKENSHKDEV
jgi:HD superfamily phosphohydrolase